MTTIHDVFRFLVRGGQNTEENQRRLLLTIEAHEKGYPDLETYEAELAKQAEVLGAGNQAAAAVEAGPNPDPRDARIAALEAQLKASERGPELSTPVPG